MSDPLLSVVVPTYGRAETTERLLARLDEQTLPAETYEVIVVDDGSPEPVRIDFAKHRPNVALLRQENAGPGAARNRALEHCRAPWTLILNDDAVPCTTLLEGHLEASRRVADKTAVLGTFRFTAAALRSPFVQILQATDLLFAFPRLRPDELHDWTFFWTCNLSLPTSVLREHRFDAERFREAIVEDVELGYRLAKHGWRVLHDPRLVCEHDHVLEPAGYFRRMQRLGVNMAKMYEKHGDPSLLGLRAASDLSPAYFGALGRNVELFHATQQKLIAQLQALEAKHTGEVLPVSLIESIGKLVRQIGTLNHWRGLLQHFERHDPGAVMERGPREGRLTSIVVVSYNALEKTRKCVEALRIARDERYPTELLFVDNGSSDGSAEWLAEQPDVRLVRNADNAGAPAARNQALALARGEWIVVMDNDAIVSPGWLRRMLFHAEVDPRSGCIGPVSDRAAHGQQVSFNGGTDLASLASFANEWGQANDRRARPQNMLTSFCLLMRREVLDTIGGFDERFSPWGFEDDDYTLRAALAGFRNRCALDVFVRHEHYGGAKAARHTELLMRNWVRFTEKWSGRSDVAYGDYKALESSLQRAFEPAQLRIPLAQPEPRAPLPTKPETSRV